MTKDDIKIGMELFIVTAGNNVGRNRPPRGFNGIVTKIGRKYFDVEYIGQISSNTITFSFEQYGNRTWFYQKSDYTAGYHAYESKDHYVQEIFLTNFNSYVKYDWSGAKTFDEAKQIAELIGANIEIELNLENNYEH